MKLSIGDEVYLDCSYYWSGIGIIVDIVTDIEDKILYRIKLENKTVGVFYERYIESIITYLDIEI